MSVRVPGLITDFSPIIVRQVSGSMTDETMRAQLDATAIELHRAQAAGLRTVTIIDLSQAAGATAAQREMQTDWLTRHDDVLRRVSLGTAFVVRSQMVRGALTGIFWLRPLPHEYTITTSLDAALDWAIDRLVSQGIAPPDRLVRARTRALLELTG